MPKSTIVPIVILMTVFCVGASAQTTTRTATLQQAAVQQAAKERALATQLQRLAKEKNWPLTMKHRNGGVAYLTGIDSQGYPTYTVTFNNIISAATIGTNKVWAGGSLGLNLSGSSAYMKGKLGLWDGGKVLNTHVEINNRVTHKDGATTVSDHSTHVAGTLMAAGVNPLAKGLSYGVMAQKCWRHLPTSWCLITPTVPSAAGIIMKAPAIGNGGAGMEKMKITSLGFTRPMPSCGIPLLIMLLFT
jgi:hypothetical protein